MLGPLFEVESLGIRYVVAAGADVIRDLNDESRFCKHLGPEIDALRVLGGDGLFTARTGEPNWFAAHNLLMPAFMEFRKLPSRRVLSPQIQAVRHSLAEWWLLRANITYLRRSRFEQPAKPSISAALF